MHVAWPLQLAIYQRESERRALAMSMVLPISAQVPECPLRCVACRLRVA